MLRAARPEAEVLGAAHCREGLLFLISPGGAAGAPAARISISLIMVLLTFRAMFAGKSSLHSYPILAVAG